MADTAVKFDRIKVNLDLAKQYIKDNKDDIENMKVPKPVDQELRKKCSTINMSIRNKLIEKLKENSPLICQLEYLTNNTPIDVTEKNLQLLIQYISLDHEKYKHTLTGQTVVDTCTINKDTPLACLGLLTEALVRGCEERAAVCHLFAKLCCESGFTLQANINSVPEAVSGLSCTGIISERSDLESAVDAFLSSPSSSACFWRLQRIFVQESLYDSFKKLLKFKTTLKDTKSTKNADLEKLCADVFEYDEKVFLVDYAGDARALQLDSSHAIFIEAYRTNKEVISLIGERAGCVSLWSADVAEANEIAYSVPAALVWINDYGNFDGPPQLSMFFFSHFLNYISSYELNHVSSSFLKHYDHWKTFDNKKRINIIGGVLEKEIEVLSHLKEPVKKRMEEVSKLQEKLFNLNLNSVDVANGKMCVVLDKPVGIHFQAIADNNTVHSLVVGNGVICGSLSTLYLYDKLVDAGVPVVSYDDCRNQTSENPKKIRIHEFQLKFKVVVTNFGTIFAN